MKQKFHRGDVVRVDVPPEDTDMFHFETGFEGIVEYSYYNRFGGGVEDKKVYSIIHPEAGSIAWYDEHQMKLVRKATMKTVRKTEQHP